MSPQKPSRPPRRSDSSSPRKSGGGNRSKPLRRQGTTSRQQRAATPAKPVLKQSSRPQSDSLIIEVGEQQPTDSDLIYGRHAVAAALESHRPLNRVWVNARIRYDPRFLTLIDEAKASGAVIEEVDTKRLNQNYRGC